MKIYEHPLWDTMNNLYFIKEYLIENFNEELPKAFWDILDESIEDIEKTVKISNN